MSDLFEVDLRCCGQNRAVLWLGGDCGLLVRVSKHSKAPDAAKDIEATCSFLSRELAHPRWAAVAYMDVMLQGLTVSAKFIGRREGAATLIAVCPQDLEAVVIVRSHLARHRQTAGPP